MTTDLETAAVAFHTAFATVPDEALAFRPEGDDYALSGLLIHVGGVIEHYALVLADIVASGFGAFVVTATPDARDMQLTHDGIAATERQATEQRIRTAHARLVQQLERLSPDELTRSAQVQFGPGSEPLATTPTDVVGWVREHYLEHVPHVYELLARWRATAA